MSDNDDLLGDDLGDQSLADYNLGNEEEEQLLADDYESGSSHNVPTGVAPQYIENDNPVEYTGHDIDFINRPLVYGAAGGEAECVVPNVEPAPFPPYRAARPDHAVVPPAIPAAPVEAPQTVPSEMPPAIANGEEGAARGRFAAERPPGAPRLPQLRDIPDSLDKVFIPRGGGFTARGRSWRNPQFNARFPHPYRRNNLNRGNFNQRNSFPQPQIRPQMRPDLHLDMRSEMRPDLRPDMRPALRSDMRPDLRPNMRPDLHLDMRPDLHPDMRPDLRPDMRPDLHPDMRPDLRPDMRPDLRPDMRPDLRADMRPDLRPDMRPDLRPDMRPELHPDMRPDVRPAMRLELRPDFRPEIRPDFRPDMRPDFRPEMRSEITQRELRRDDLPPEIRRDPRPDLPLDMPPHKYQMGPEISPERPMVSDFRARDAPFPYPRFFRPEEPTNFNPVGPNFEPRQMLYRPSFNPRFPSKREIVSNSVSHMPQVTIRNAPPAALQPSEKDKVQREPEVRMLPVQLPPNLPPGGLAGERVLINPHFKGNFQPPADVLPTYIPTRIQKSPPLSPTLGIKLGPIQQQHIDAAAERFIAEQRSALARAAARGPRRSPQRYIENTTIEIENELASSAGRDDELLRRQEEFISANRAGLRRRMRSPSPPPRRSRSPSPLPRRDEKRDRPDDKRDRPDDKRDRPDDKRDRLDEKRDRLDDKRDRLDDKRDRSDRERHNDSPQESEYRRKLREQESLRERVLRAKEVRRRKNAVALHQGLLDRERESHDVKKEQKSETTDQVRPDTTRTTPDRSVAPDRSAAPVRSAAPDKPTRVEKTRERSPVKVETAEVNSTCENLTPPRAPAVVPPSPERALTPPLPAERRADSDDDLDLILGDIDGILSDEEDARLKDKPAKADPPKAKSPGDLRARLASRPHSERRPPRQKIVFNENKERDKKRKDKCSPPRRALVSSSTKPEDSERDRRHAKTNQKTDTSSKSRQRIIFENKEKQQEREDQKFSRRRVIIQRKAAAKADKSVFARIEDPSKPNAGIFTRAVTALNTDKGRVVVAREPRVDYSSGEEEPGGAGVGAGAGVAAVSNLPPGMTDTRLRTLAGGDVQSLSLDKEDRSAKITFKSVAAAEHFKKKFNNKMVAASRLTVALR